MIASDATVQNAAEHLARHDAILAPIIVSAGPCTIRPHRQYYQELVDSIISQQLSIKAAVTIKRRFRELFGHEQFPPPEAILTKSIDELRSAGLSRGKATYIRDLAQHIVDGHIRLNHLDRLTNEQIIAELTAVKGIGEWTSHMFLMFCMGRLDVLAHGDLGIRNGIKTLYSLDHLPSAIEVQQIAKDNRWHPYETAGCWYVWQSIDNAPAVIPNA